MSRTTTRPWAAVCAIAGASAVVVLAAAVGPHGAALTPDSATYLAGATSMAHGRGYLDIDGVTPMLDFPPLYPALLTPLLRAGLSVAATTGTVAVVCGLAQAVLTVLLGRSVGLRPAGALVAALAVVACPPMLDTYTSALSEAPFCTLLTGALVLLTRIAAVGRVGLGSGVALSATVAAVALTRYVGLALVGGVCLAVLLSCGRGWRRLLAPALIGIGGCLPPACWLFRNHAAAGRFTAPDYAASSAGPLSHLGDDLAGIGGWVLPDGTRPWTLIVGLAAMALPVHALTARGGSGRPQPDRGVRAVGVVCLVYAAGLLAGQSLVGLDTGDRFVRPLAPALIVLAAVRLTGVRFAVRPPVRAGVPLVCALVVGLVGLHWARGIGQRVGDAGAAGLGEYDNPTTAASPLAAALRTDRPTQVIVSNDAYAVFLLARRPAEQSPVLTFDNSTVPTGDLEQFAVDVADAPRLLAWFDHPDVDNLVELRELQHTVCLRPVARLGDGELLVTCGSVPRP